MSQTAKSDNFLIAGAARCERCLIGETITGGLASSSLSTAFGGVVGCLANGEPLGVVPLDPTGVGSELDAADECEDVRAPRDKPLPRPRGAFLEAMIVVGEGKDARWAEKPVCGKWAMRMRRNRAGFVVRNR